jgi:hypothetical protein
MRRNFIIKIMLAAEKEERGGIVIKINIRIKADESRRK